MSISATRLLKERKINTPIDHFSRYSFTNVGGRNLPSSTPCQHQHRQKIDKMCISECK